MTASLVPAGDHRDELTQLAAEAVTYLARRRAANTLRAYAADWADFEAFCTRHGLAALPAEPGTVALYLVGLARRHKASTLRRRLATISRAHKANGLASPTEDVRLRELHEAIRRTIGVAKSQKRPLLVSELRLICQALPDTRAGHRDRALLTVGFTGAFRRSELVSFDVQDLNLRIDHVEVTLRRSKGDQEGAGHVLYLPRSQDPQCCPLRALRCWMHVAQISSGPVFRPVDRWDNIKADRLADHAVPTIVRRRATEVGLPGVDLLSGHSLRAGYVSELAALGVPDHLIALQSRHADLRVLREYVRLDSLLGGEAARTLGL